MTLLQPGSGTAYATSVRVVWVPDCPLSPATSLAPPPQPARTAALSASAMPLRKRRGVKRNIGDLSLHGGIGPVIPYCGRWMHQRGVPIEGHSRHRTADGRGSATTTVN